MFPAYDAHPDKREPTLEDKPYRRLMETLYANGSEIAFHGLSPRAEAPSLKECTRRAALLDDFNPKTWIDHGSGSYLLSRNATLNGGVRLTDFLDDFGIENYWSHIDVWNNPFRNLSSWQRRTDKNALDDLQLSLKTVRERGDKQRAYLFVHALRNLDQRTPAKPTQSKVMA